MNLPIEQHPAEETELEINPFLEPSEGSIRDPLSGRTIVSSHALWPQLRALLRGSPVAELTADTRAALTQEGLLRKPGEDLSRRYRLRIVSLETNTVCNQRCFFCPVSTDPRPSYSMPDALFDRIVQQLAEYRTSLDAIFLHNYNEPTVDPRFVENHVRLLLLGLPVALATNGTGLTPTRVDGLMEAGRLRYAGVNFSTMDGERYRQTRGRDHAAQVLANLDYMASRTIADDMRILVFGTGDDAHRADFAAITERFAGSLWTVEYQEVMDRAGWLEVGKHAAPIRTLRGCNNMGSRPLEHIHITPQGRCVLCCEDYDERYVVGDLNASTIDEVLSGDEMARLRRWIYGLEQAPDDFICRRCIYARSGDGDAP